MESSERDELLAIIFPVLDSFLGYRGGYPADVDRAIADAILAAGYSKEASCITGDSPFPPPVVGSIQIEGEGKSRG